MSRRAADIRAKRAQMFPDIMALAAKGYVPTPQQRVAFDYFALSEEARLVAMSSARRCRATAAAIYAAIANSLVPR